MMNYCIAPAAMTAETPRFVVVYEDLDMKRVKSHVIIPKNTKPSSPPLPRPREGTLNNRAVARGCITPQTTSSSKNFSAPFSKSPRTPLAINEERFCEFRTSPNADGLRIIDRARLSSRKMDETNNGDGADSNAVASSSRGMLVGGLAVPHFQSVGGLAVIPEGASEQDLVTSANNIDQEQGNMATTEAGEDNKEGEAAAVILNMDQKEGMATTKVMRRQVTSTTVTTPGSNNSSPNVDKDLPPKPALRGEESPERRGIFDAADSASKSLTFPTLAPGPSARLVSARRVVSSSNVSHSAPIGSVSDIGSPYNRKPLPRKPLPFNNSPKNTENLSPRTRIGVGPTLRVSKDADEVIMGKAAGSSKRVTSTSHTVPRAVRPNHIGGMGPIHPPRSSSLPSSPESVGQGNKTPAPSLVDRLSRPTKASAQRATESKAVINERGKSSPVRKQGVSPAFDPKRRVSAPASMTKIGSTTTLKKKGFRSTMAALIPSRNRSNTRQGPPVDRVAPKVTARNRDSAADVVAQIQQETNADRAGPINIRSRVTTRRANDNEDDDPIPPANNPVSSADHYNENNPGITAMLDRSLADAEECLFYIVDQIDLVQDATVRARLLQLIRELEAAITAARVARMAAIVLHESIAALITDTSAQAASAMDEARNAVSVALRQAYTT